MQNTPQSVAQSVDVFQQFDQLLKNHSILISDRESLTKLFEQVFDLCTQIPKTRFKAAVKAATQEFNPKAQKAQKAQKAEEVMVGSEGAADAPMISDLQKAPVARGRGRPRKTSTEDIESSANATPNVETAEKKRRGRPKKDKSVTISSNDDEDALIEQMMADVASMQKDEQPVVAVHVIAASSIPSLQVVDYDETETEDEMSPVVHEIKSAMPTFVVEADVPLANATKPKAVKEPKPKAVNESNTKAVNEPKPVETVQPLASFSKPMPHVVIPKIENHEVNGSIYLQVNFPTASFTWNGKTYLRTETDNVYDNLTLEMVGVWDHANHEIIQAFDDDDMCLSDDEE